MMRNYFQSLPTLHAILQIHQMIVDLISPVILSINQRVVVNFFDTNLQISQEHNDSSKGKIASCKKDSDQ